jgi:hypothetical protein
MITSGDLWWAEPVLFVLGIPEAMTWLRWPWLVVALLSGVYIGFKIGRARK